MLVKIKKSALFMHSLVDHVRYEAGTAIDLDDSKALQLIECGIAVIPSEVKKPARRERQTVSVKTREIIQDED